MVNTLEQKLIDENRRLYQLATNPLRSHGPDHHWRVFQNALRLAETIGSVYDRDVLAGAALLHDLAAYYPEEIGDNYHDHDHIVAGQALERVSFPKEKIQAVIDAIANHGSDPKYKRNNESVETTILRDADKLDVFGPIGVARIIMVRTMKGDTMDEIADDFWTKGHLKRKWQSITSEAAREMAREEYEYSRVSFSRLTNSLKPN